MSLAPFSNRPIRTEYVGDSKDRNHSHKWWTLPDDQIHKGVFTVVADLDQSDSSRQAANAYWHMLYSNRAVQRNRGRSPARTAARIPVTSDQDRLTCNIISVCTDAAAAKIAKSTPRPRFETVDGDFDLQRKAELLQAYVDGVFYDSKAGKVAQAAFRDACVFGTGVIFVGWEKAASGEAQVFFECVNPDEILVDDNDGRYGEPSQVHRRKWVLRDRLCEMFPEHREEISHARGDKTSLSRTDQSDQLETIESWHLPSQPGAKDGKHSICVDGLTLFSEPYEPSFLPFCFFHWNPPVTGQGFWGTGLADQLEPIQLEISRLCRDITNNLRLIGQGRCFIEHGTQVVASHLNPGDGTKIPIVRYVGKPPVFQTAQAMNAEAYQERDRWIKLALEQTGISQLTANATKPAGMNSGAALREYGDQTSERFQLTSQRWEELHMDMARKVVDMSRRRFRKAKDKGLSVSGRVDRFLRRIKWSECDLDEDRFQLRVTPTSILPTTPAGKIQAVQEFVQAGWIGREEALEMLQLPDLERFVSLATASHRHIQWTISRILNDGEPGNVEELVNLEQAAKAGMVAVLNAEMNNVPDERVELLRRWVDAVKDRLLPPPADNPVGVAQAANDNAQDPQSQSPQVTDAGATAQPMGVPATPPTSELLPVNGAA